jgi:hypothetical protein
MGLTDQLAARLTARFGMRVPPETADKMQAVRKRVGVAAGATVTPEVLERLLFADGVPCAWTFDQDADMTYFSAYYVGGRGDANGNP